MRQGYNNLFLAVLLWIKKLNDLSQSSATTKIVFCETSVATKTANRLKQSEIILNQQKPSRSSRSEVFCKRGVLRNFTKFTGKHLCKSVFFNKVAGLRPVTLPKKRLWHTCLPVNFVKFLRTRFFTEHLWWLLLTIRNHPETTQNYLHQQNLPATLQSKEPPNLTLFFCCWLWRWFLNQESRTSKKWQTSTTDHESQRQIVNLFLQFWEITLKQIYNRWLNEIV